MDYRAIFEDIYKNRRWGKIGPASGEGSHLIAAMPFTQFLAGFLAGKSDISRILDLGCGDLKQWPRGFFKKYKYIGIDLVASSAEEELNNFECTEKSFISGNIIEIELPQADLAIIKDVLIHLPYEDFAKILPRLASVPYIILVTDTQSVGWRVSLGKVKRALKAKELSSNPFRRLAYARKILEGDIKPGHYHWFDVNRFKAVILANGFSIEYQSVFKVKGFTKGRSTDKQLTLLYNKKSATNNS